MPPSFSVTGGRALKGTIRPAGNKNAALPILAATLLARGPCRIDNVPHIRDVETMLALLAHLDNRMLDLDGVNYVALRAYGAAGGQRVAFNEMSRMKGVVPVKGELIPVLATFSDPANPSTMRAVPSDDLAASFGSGFGLRGVSVEAVPNGFWPIDFGGPLGEPVTRGIEAKLPWLKRTDDSAAIALKAANLTGKEAFDAREVFTRQ